jgi:hypothetical protein
VQTNEKRRSYPTKWIAEFDKADGIPWICSARVFKVNASDNPGFELRFHLRQWSCRYPPGSAL